MWNWVPVSSHPRPSATRPVRWGRLCVLPDGHETSMEEPHWGRNSEGRPIAWVGSAPDSW
ncbi:hypothetical protein ABZ669_13410 [Streptomyces hirsutus]|uniref:hypothetical protein n=1 Tax=Streptomyces TaxID=1883 RepID=UPI002FC9E80A